MKRYVSLFVIVAGCGPYTQAAQPTGQTDRVDHRSASQIIVDVLGGQGYKCSVTDLGNYECWGPNAKWQFYVTQNDLNDGSIQILLESWVARAFARPCAKFAFAMQDITDQKGVFSATCTDETKQFIFRTTLRWEGSFNVFWIHDHESRRSQAGAQLRSIHALTADAGRMVASP